MHCLAKTQSVDNVFAIQLLSQQMSLAAVQLARSILTELSGKQTEYCGIVTAV